MSATDRIRAVHREATSSPWDERWSLEVDADEHGYTREYTVASDVGWIATFAYAQHLELFIQAKRHMEALCDLADGARGLLADAEDAGWAEGSVAAGQVEGALARLDREDGDG